MSQKKKICKVHLRNLAPIDNLIPNSFSSFVARTVSYENGIQVIIQKNSSPHSSDILYLFRISPNADGGKSSTHE